MIHTSAPARVGLLGGYSILEKGNASYSITLDARVHAEIKPAGKINLQAAQYGIESNATWDGKRLVLENDTPSAVFLKSAVQTALTFLDLKKIKIR